jgi:hypothetical protein
MRQNEYIKCRHAGKVLSGIHRLEKGNMQYYVYILACKKNGTLYVGVTSDLIKRVFEHKNDFVEGFTKHYTYFLIVVRDAPPEFLSSWMLTRD